MAVQLVYLDPLVETPRIQHIARAFLAKQPATGTAPITRANPNGPGVRAAQAKAQPPLSWSLPGVFLGKVVQLLRRGHALFLQVALDALRGATEQSICNLEWVQWLVHFAQSAGCTTAPAFLPRTRHMIMMPIRYITTRTDRTTVTMMLPRVEPKYRSRVESCSGRVRRAQIDFFLSSQTS